GDGPTGGTTNRRTRIQLRRGAGAAPASTLRWRMDWLWLIPVVGLLVVAAVLLAWRPLHLFGQEIQVERARELFVLQRERLEAKFVTAASASGKPRGLRWKDCNFENDLELARDRQSGELVALVPVTVQFEAVEGGD